VLPDEELEDFWGVEFVAKLNRLEAAKQGPQDGNSKLRRSRLGAPLFTLAHGSTVTNYQPWVYQSLTGLPNREQFSLRIGRYLSGIRRGNLKFPVNFPREIHRLTELSKTQVRKQVFAFEANSALYHSVDNRVVGFAREIFSRGELWTQNIDHNVLERQTSRVPTLKSSDWPRLGTRAAWPSSPSIAELMEMSQTGATPAGLRTNGVRAKHSITMAHFRSNPELCKRVIHRQVIGVRAGIELPEKFLKFFRYKWGFLILVAPWAMPIGLARKLAGLWKSNPHSLWLQDKCSLKSYLRSTSHTGFTCATIGPW